MLFFLVKGYLLWIIDCGFLVIICMLFGAERFLQSVVKHIFCTVLSVLFSIVVFLHPYYGFLFVMEENIFYERCLLHPQSLILLVEYKIDPLEIHALMTSPSSLYAVRRNHGNLCRGDEHCWFDLLRWN